MYLFQFFVQKWIKQITRQDRYLQYFGRGFFFSEDSQLFGRDSFGGNTVGTQIAHTSPKWVPFTHQALYIRKLFPLNETPILVVTIFIKIGSQLSPCKNKFLTNFINHYHLQYHDNWQGRRQKSFLYKYIHQKWKTLACVVMEVLIQSICGS